MCSTVPDLQLSNLVASSLTRPGYIPVNLKQYELLLYIYSTLHYVVALRVLILQV